MIDDQFLNQVRDLQVSEMGTESVAPLLYWVTRMVRPRTVLEVGMGYTTPFLAQALDDNAREDAALRVHGLEAIHNTKYFHASDRSHNGRLFCIDSFEDPNSSARQVALVLSKLGLQNVTVQNNRMESVTEDVAEALQVIDFAWIDTWDSLAFIERYWDLINPRGGVLAVHWLLTNPPGRATAEYIASLAGPDGGRLETLHLVEPHKNYQNSLMLVRRVRDYVDPFDLRPLGDALDQPSLIARRRSGSEEE